MSFLKRFANIGAGLGAGLLAYRLISRYEQKRVIEAEYRELTDSEAQKARENEEKIASET